MVIQVTTGGPIEAIGPLVPNDNPDFSVLIAQIADEVDDTTGEYSSQIQSSVFTAIRYCEREPYYFNQTRDVTFPTVDGQEFYGYDDNTAIPDLIRIEAVYSEDSQGQRSQLLRWRPEQMELVSDNSAARGEPYAFVYYERKLRLYPIPGATVYTIRLQLSPYRLAPITNASDTNVWITEAFDMIKARAKYILYKDIMKEATLAAEALSDFEDQRGALRAETSRRNGSGVIAPTCF